MNRQQANNFLQRHLYDLEIDKFDGVWYMVNAYRSDGKGIANNEPSCMNITRLSEITNDELLYHAKRLTTP